MKNEPTVLYIGIPPIGVYVQSCAKCAHDKFIRIDQDKYLVCAKCKTKIAEFSANHTAALENKGGCEGCTLQ